MASHKRAGAAIVLVGALVSACGPRAGSRWHYGSETKFKRAVAVAACPDATSDKARADFQRFPIADDLTLAGCTASIDPATGQSMLNFGLDEMSDRQIVYVFDDRGQILDRYWWAPTANAHSKF